MMRITLFVCLIAFATCQPGGPDHHGPGHVHITDEYRFEYSEKAGYMVLTTPDECYLWKLDDAEVASLKDPTAVKTLEMTMFGMLGSSATELDHHSIPHEIGAHCEHHHKVYELSASSGSAGTTPSTDMGN